MSSPFDPDAVLDGLRHTLRELRKGVPERFDAPSADATLNFEGRDGNKVREFRHILQMGTMQVMVLKRVSAMKLVYLLDLYVAAAERRNPLGLYIAARSVLEFHAFANTLAVRLDELRGGEESSWKDRGIAFYDSLIRARFGTSRKELVSVMQQQGRRAADVAPQGANSMIRELSKRTEFTEALSYYGVLCDFVHPNASSQNIMMNEIKTSPVSGFADFVVVTKEPGPVMSFEFPSEHAYRHAFEFTSEQTLKSSRDTAELIARWPEFCFREEECLCMTGTPIGMPQSTAERERLNAKVAAEEERIRRARSVGRNDPCPCGSGLKAKKCCAR
jgi:hypothetical protein